MSGRDEKLEQLRNEERVLTAMETMLKCDRSSLCLLKEWLRRYGTPGTGCRCWWVFSESYVDDSHPELDL